MQTVIYDSDAYCVLQLDWAARANDSEAGRRGGFEIIDKLAGMEVFLAGPVADDFRQRVQQLVQQSPDADDIDNLLEGYAELARQPLLQH